ncbi:MAG: D-alanyl-D-alanine carboxypeptidase, partial [Treponema sp.]|nr:D-alanyl-D-alanine carboxypeptidase [Treponema sp.]
PGGDRIRDRDGERLLSWAFENFQTVRPATAPPETARLWKGKEKYARLVPTAPLSFTSPAGRAAALAYTAEVDNPLLAPLPAQFPAGWLVISDNEGELHRVRLVTEKEYQRGNIFRRIWDSIRLFFI